MKAKENAPRIVRFQQPEPVLPAPPTYDLRYWGVDHKGFAGGGHDSPVGAKWIDIWGTGWHEELEGVMGFPRLNPLAEVSALKDYQWPPTGVLMPMRLLERAPTRQDPGGNPLASQASLNSLAVLFFGHKLTAADRTRDEVPARVEGHGNLQRLEATAPADEHLAVEVTGWGIVLAKVAAQFVAQVHSGPDDLVATVAADVVVERVGIARGAGRTGEEGF